jgi:hypothetical protein
MCLKSDEMRSDGRGNARNACSRANSVTVQRKSAECHNS